MMWWNCRAIRNGEGVDQRKNSVDLQPVGCLVIKQMVNYCLRLWNRFGTESLGVSSVWLDVRVSVGGSAHLNHAWVKVRHSRITGGGGYAELNQDKTKVFRQL